jgi:hypothetical protein
VSIWVSLDVDGIQHPGVIQCLGRYLSSAKASEVMARRFITDGHIAGRGCLDSYEAFTLPEIQTDLESLNGLTVHSDIPGIEVQPVTRSVPPIPARARCQVWVSAPGGVASTRLRSAIWSTDCPWCWGPQARGHPPNHDLDFL